MRSPFAPATMSARTSGAGSSVLSARFPRGVTLTVIRGSYFRAGTVLVAIACAATVAVMAAYGTASAQSSPATTITVSTTLDEETPSTDGQCSFREALLNARSGDKRPFPDCAAGSAELD